MIAEESIDDAERMILEAISAKRNAEAVTDNAAQSDVDGELSNRGLNDEE
jgi:hypothetical protein